MTDLMWRLLVIAEWIVVRDLLVKRVLLKQASIPIRSHDLVDGRLYRETPDKVAYRIQEGCSVVEMGISLAA